MRRLILQLKSVVLVLFLWHTIVPTRIMQFPLYNAGDCILIDSTAQCPFDLSLPPKFMYTSDRPTTETCNKTSCIMYVHICMCKFMYQYIECMYSTCTQPHLLIACTRTRRNRVSLRDSSVYVSYMTY